MSLEPVTPALFAALGGTALVVGMFGKLATIAARGYLMRSRDHIHRLELTVCGQRYSVGLDKIEKDDIEKIEQAVAAVKKAQEIKKAEESA
jgi:hypothetical protein